MSTVSLRPMVMLGAGVVIGLLIAWGLFGGFSIGSGNAAGTLAATPSQLGVEPAVSATPSATAEAAVVEANPSPSGSASSSPTTQSNGLPLGVTKDAVNYNKEIYSRYPGLQPPVINTDGRNLGAEATQRMEGPPTMLPPSATETSSSPMPFRFQSGDGSSSPAPSAR